MISGLLAKVPVKTFANGKETKGDDWYALNFSPNENETANQFFNNIVSKLLRNNECLIVPFNNQLYVADSFCVEPYALYSDVFYNVTIKNFTLQTRFTAKDVIYLRYADADVSALLSGVLDDYNNFLSLAADKYKQAGGRKAIVQTNINPQQTLEWQKALDDLYGERFKKFFENENGLVVMPDGLEYKDFSNTGDSRATVMNDIKTITDEIFEMVGVAFKLSPALLKGNVQDTSKAIEQTLTFAVDPLVNCIEEGFNKSYYGKQAIMHGYYCKFDTTAVKHVDLFDVADKVDKYIADGTYSIDEMREKLGDTPIGEEWSQTHWITKNYADAQFVDTADSKSEGGENDEEG